MCKFIGDWIRKKRMNMKHYQRMALRFWVWIVLNRVPSLPPTSHCPEMARSHGNGGQVGKFNRVDVQTATNWETGRTRPIRPIKNYMSGAKEILAKLNLGWLSKFAVRLPGIRGRRTTTLVLNC